MKYIDNILLLTSPRVGGTNIMLSLSDYYSKEYSFEPIDIMDAEFDCSNKVVKYVPYNLEYIKNPNDFNYESIIDLAKKFDVVILIDRINKKEQIESFYSLMKYKTFNKKWSYDSMDIDETTYNEFERFINKTSSVLNQLSKDLKIEINYYEDVFKNKKINNLDINLSEKFFDSKYKLRQYKKNII